MHKLRVFIVEDFTPWIHLLQSLLSDDAMFEVVGTASDGYVALKRAEELKPDLVLLDVDIPTVNGIDLARSMQHFRPKPLLLFVSQNVQPSVIRAAFEAGANGYVVKSEAKRYLLEAIRVIGRGEQFLSPSLKEMSL